MCNPTTKQRLDTGHPPHRPLARALGWIALACLLILASGAWGDATVPKALPSAAPFDTKLRETLEAELESRGPDYKPRTRHLRAAGTPIFTNRLLLETSPYLQQHAHNPVDWRPWGDEAFEAARRLDRPVLVSIGYSTCHWCHVMEEESFDDPAVAALLNANFITIKVDRETRPDVDSIYMTSVQALTGSGGWPLNVWLTPDRKPFFGGTYFPPADRGGRPGFPSVLTSIRDQWQQRRPELVEMAGSLAAAVRQELEGLNAASSQAIGPDALRVALRTIKRRADPTWGGVGTRTKFPSSLPIRLLLRVHRRSGDVDALKMAELALEKMASGGLQDQIGGGFHRYSTERRWLVPHFEKMLYDNALLAVAYLEGWQATGRDDFARVARRTLDYVAREMTAPDGGFYSATDADSLNPEGEMEEGWFFTWTGDEIDGAVGPERGRILRAAYGVTNQGNFEGRNILTTWTPLAEAASSLGMTEAAFAAQLEPARDALLEARRARPQPLRDDKILSAWNGLMISAFARAGFAFDDSDYVERARRAASAALAARDAQGRLPRTRQGGRSAGPAFLEDHAFMIAALVDLYEASGEVRWLREAVALQSVLDRFFADVEGGGYYRTRSDAEVLIAREKPAHDGALPSGNAVAALNLLRLYDLTLAEHYADTVTLLFSAFAPTLESSPASVSELLLALDYRLDKGFEIVIVSGKDGAAGLLEPLRDAFVPNRVLSVSGKADASLEAHAALVPLVAGKRAVGDLATAYVCRNRVCDYPTNDPGKLREQLSASTELQLRVPPTPGL